MPLLSKKSPAAFGLLLCLAALYRCATLSGSGWDHLLVPLAMLSLLILALLLLKRAGFSENALAAALFPLGLAFSLRAFLMPCVTSDYQNFLSHWVEYFRQNGGFLALKDPVGNYNVPYLYMLAALSCLPLNDLYGIKLFSILFDVLLAWGGLRLARTRTADRSVWLITFFSLLLLPTVVLNGACWGQCDSVWAALCLHALACALEDKPVPSLVLLALAFSFKLQAIFLIPLWAAFWFAGKLRTHELFAFPLAFFLSISPALMLGKPLGAILSIYLEQAGDSVAWQTVNYNSPSLFSLFPYRFSFSPAAPKLAIAAAFAFMLAVLALLFFRRKHLDGTVYLLAAAALSLGIPFLLPYMHERYFFLGGVLLVVWACLWPRHTPAAAGAELASLGGYHAYLMGRYLLPLTLFGTTWAQPLEGLCMLAAILTVTVTFLFSLYGKKSVSP